MKQLPKELLDAFFEWFKGDPHSKREDAYAGEVTKEHLSGLSQQKFIELFMRFYREGGQLQNPGRRPKQMEQTLSEQYEAFRAFVLEPFEDEFRVDAWLDRLTEFKEWGIGTATIYLNRVDKNRFLVLNEKTVNGLQRVGIDLPIPPPWGPRYQAVTAAQRELMEQDSRFGNFFQTDSFMHFLIDPRAGKGVADTFLPRDRRKRYWAGGFLWGGNESKLELFIEGNYWQHGYDRDSKDGKKVWRAFDKIEPGDEFAVKGLGGNHRLRVHYLGEVTAVDKETGRIELRKLDRPLYQGPAPKRRGAGNWFNTLLGVTRKDIIEQVFSPSSAVPLALNTIFYGPPGTGKTYRALTEIAEEHFVDEIEEQPKEQFGEQLVQELPWWQVIVVVMLDLGKASVTQIMEHPLMAAKVAQSSNKTPRQGIWNHLQAHTKDECPHVKTQHRAEPRLFGKDEKSVWSIDVETAHEVVPELEEKLASYRDYQPQRATEKRYEFVTFHQSYSYEDFVEGIRPVMDEEEAPGELRYEIKVGVFQELCNRARRNAGKPYALFIDEINRGNVASIFGELITLIEADKREGANNQVTVRLPYSRKEFTVPRNLYIVGTMNTADRSVEALDTALRRRFAFVEMPPVLDHVPEEPVEGIDLRKLLGTINARIEALLDKDHCIGHSYLMDIRTLDQLRGAFCNSILPLLEEYFYGNPAKIGMVLGDRFVTREPSGVSFAKGIWGADDYDVDAVYHVEDPDKLEADDFQSIYQANG